MSGQISARDFVKYSWNPGKPADLRSWSDVVAPLFDIEPLEEPFAATLTSYALGELLFSVSTGTAQRFIRDQGVVDRGGADLLLVQTYTRGGFVTLIDGRNYSVETGDVSCIDLSCTFDSVAPAFSCYTLTIPRALLSSVLPPSSHIRVLPAGLARSHVLTRHFQALAELCVTSDPFDCDVLGMLTVALLKAALVHDEHDPLMPGPDDSSVFARMCRFIDANVTDPNLSAERLAAEFGTSRATLYRMFSRFGGVASFIRKRRLIVAFRELSSEAGGHERISSLAHRCGYRSEDTFARVFKEEYGLGPAEWKRSLVAGRKRSEGQEHRAVSASTPRP